MNDQNSFSNIVLWEHKNVSVSDGAAIEKATGKSIFKATEFDEVESWSWSWWL